MQTNIVATFQCSACTSVLCTAAIHSTVANGNFGECVGNPQTIRLESLHSLCKSVNNIIIRDICLHLMLTHVSHRSDKVTLQDFKAIFSRQGSFRTSSSGRS